MIRVSVPATSANLGPGFDCLGLALELYLEVEAKLSEEDAFFYQGEGSLPNTPDNLMHQGYKLAFKECGKPAPPIRFFAQNPIPLARGLGSSSAALVAGIVIANEVMNDALGKDGIFQLSAKIEGHPDNVAPAVYGGFTVSAQRADGSYLSETLELPDWTFLFAVPGFELLTSKARSVLPHGYKAADVIFNTSRTALWSLAVAQNKPELLRLASQDRMHEPYRAPLIPGLLETQKALLDAGAYAAFLSGAGPTMGVILSEQTLERCTSLLTSFIQDGKILNLKASKGYKVQKAVP